MGAGSSAGHHAVNSVVSSSSKSNTPNETPYSKTSCEAEFKTYIECSKLYEYGGEATLVKRDDAGSIDNFRQDCDGLLESYMKCMRSLGGNQG